MAIANLVGEVLAHVALDATLAVAQAGGHGATTTVITPSQVAQITLQERMQCPPAQINVIAYTPSVPGAGTSRLLVVNEITPGSVYQVASIDATGALANLTGGLRVTFVRGGVNA